MNLCRNIGKQICNHLAKRGHYARVRNLPTCALGERSGILEQAQQTYVRWREVVDKAQEHGL